MDTIGLVFFVLRGYGCVDDCLDAKNRRNRLQFFDGHYTIKNLRGTCEVWSYWAINYWVDPKWTAMII